MHGEIYMLWLSSLVAHLTSRKLNELLTRFGSAKEVFSAPRDVLRSIGSLSPLALDILTRDRNLSFIEDLLRILESNKIVYISREHEAFPMMLAAIPDPPIGIFYIGELPPEDLHKVSIIGSRKCSEYGLMAAGKLAAPLAQRGIVIVSGMARGVDSMAHRSALEGGGKTIAVLGCGADICYPREAHPLRKKIIENGCVLSEYPPGTQPHKAFFPARNRIISGLSHAVVVAEAGRKSGTLITVDTAHDQGREVLAVPGNISSKLSEGTNRLIRDGAFPVIDYTDVLFALGISGEVEPEVPPDKNTVLAPDEKRVYDVVHSEAVHFDAIPAQTGLTLSQCHMACIALELKKLIRKLPGARYVKL
ncbi:MAG: DNA-processing protein DprA [Defluviitaleaceae bacterium]|nr:DNA-processing protein DprA [Defluviitaleaceae bacterium]